jgi:hypothetical protein
MLYMRAKFVFEKFKEDSDPIKDLGIGRTGWFSRVREFFYKEFSNLREDNL